MVKQRNYHMPRQIYHSQRTTLSNNLVRALFPLLAYESTLKLPIYYHKFGAIKKEKIK